MGLSIVIACLGKRLRENKITEEYKKRIEEVIKIAQEFRNENINISMVVFSGGSRNPEWKTEAEAGKSEFFSQLLKNENNRVLAELLRDRVFLDPLAKNTIENVENICRELQCQGVQPKSVHVVLVSSDYHIDRLLMIDRLMPLQSLCAPIQQLVGKLSFRRALYPHNLNDPQTQVYLLKDGLNIIRVNLEGVCGIKKVGKENYAPDNITVDRMIDDVVHHFALIVNELKNVKANIRNNDKRELLAKILLESLEPCQDYFEKLTSRAFFLNNKELDKLKDHYKKLDNAIDMLNEFDPDNL